MDRCLDPEEMRLRAAGHELHTGAEDHFKECSKCQEAVKEGQIAFELNEASRPHRPDMSKSPLGYRQRIAV